MHTDAHTYVQLYARRELRVEQHVVVTKPEAHSWRFVGQGSSCSTRRSYRCLWRVLQVEGAEGRRAHMSGAIRQAPSGKITSHGAKTRLPVIHRHDDANRMARLLTRNSQSRLVSAWRCASGRSRPEYQPCPAWTLQAAGTNVHQCRPPMQSDCLSPKRNASEVDPHSMPLAASARPSV